VIFYYKIFNSKYINFMCPLLFNKNKFSIPNQPILDNYILFYAQVMIGWL